MSASTEDKRGERRFFSKACLLMEGCRLRTFAGWKNKNVKPEDMAAALLYSLRHLDYTRCIFCSGTISMWCEGDIPAVEHQKHLFDCQAPTNPRNFGNIPLQGSDDEFTKACRFLHDYHDFLVSSTLPRPPKEILRTDAVKELKVEKTAFPYLTTTSNREQTFLQWPRDVGITREVMAEAGFFYLGVADLVQCYYCGGGLLGWLQSDDPLKDHARFYSFCPFVQEKLGEEEVKRIVTENPPPKTKDRSVKLTDDEVEMVMAHPMLKYALTMPLVPENVKAAVKLRIEKDGFLYRDVQKFAEVVFDYAEEIHMQKSRAAKAAEAAAAAAASPPTTEETKATETTEKE